MTSTPAWRGLIVEAWSLFSRKFERDLAKMGDVRPALMRVVYSQLSDAQAADRVRDVARSNPRGAEATLSYVKRNREHALQYDTDRAYRILRAAIDGTSPAPIADQHAALFERERQLGWSPLQDAFARLAASVPELSELARVRGSDPHRTSTMSRELVGPRSTQSDPLLRSGLAATVVARYLGALEQEDASARLQRPVWP